jgi:dehydrodolichyl diphosphate syntase complex subunit NUS1
MAPSGTPTQATFRRGTFKTDNLSPEQREAFLAPFLPSEPSSSTDAPPPRPRRKSKPAPKKRTSPARNALYFVLFHAISLLFSIFFRFRRAWRLVRGKVVALLKYHHRTPEFIAHDVKALQKLPKHLSVIVEYHEDDETQGNAGLEGLVNNVCEIAAWAASAGIPFLSVYERTGASCLFSKIFYQDTPPLTPPSQASSKTTSRKPTPASGTH